MISIDELGQKPDPRLAVKIEDSVELAGSLDDLSVTMKDAIAMDLSVTEAYFHRTYFAVSIYHPNNESMRAARKERLRLSAISMSSEQTATAGDSVWLGIEPYVALYTHGERRQFVFEVGSLVPDSSIKTFVTDLGLAILRNAHLVERLRVDVEVETWFLKTFFSLGAWKGAFTMCLLES